MEPSLLTCRDYHDTIHTVREMLLCKSKNRGYFLMILVTGCCGFIGSHLTERLLKEGEDVLGIDNFDSYYAHQLKLRNLWNS